VALSLVAQMGRFASALLDCFIASLFLVTVKVRLWIFPSPVIHRFNRPFDDAALSHERIDTLCQRRWLAVARASRIVPGATCLVRALALQGYLAVSGIHTEVCYGVRRDARQMRAHAWLERRGICVGRERRGIDAFSKLDDAGGFR